MSGNAPPSPGLTAAEGIPLAFGGRLSPCGSVSPAPSAPASPRPSHARNPDSAASVPLSATSSAAADAAPEPTQFITSMGSRTSAPPGTVVVPAPLCVFLLPVLVVLPLLA